ncbi:hypothetical protein PHLCEN_2v7124 [Hermanssonia centrifuga]|uniref:DEAD/DEAH-box helicase domain-containing protein n=1 Tax=Hermanssonia centrifuga TaxID=98765 RepID=A0A2R6NXG4_9APHY|nr:hypothetical protein PHLCEN_2v7124 [Hermanssonia centrifuga]
MAVHAKHAQTGRLSYSAHTQFSASDNAQWPRRRLTQKEVGCLTLRMRTEYGWKADPKPFQLAGVQAQLEGVDMIIQASTGAGKTAIAAGPHLWKQGMVSIMVCPLMTLEDEMV